MAVSLWLLFDQQLYLQSAGVESTDYFVGTYIILGVGMLMTLVGECSNTQSRCFYNFLFIDSNIYV